jgi:hypothetical protein
VLNYNDNVDGLSFYKLHVDRSGAGRLDTNNCTGHLLREEQEQVKAQMIDSVSHSNRIPQFRKESLVFAHHVFFFFTNITIAIQEFPDNMADRAHLRRSDSRPTAVMQTPHAGLLPFLLSTLSSVTRR